MQLALYRRRAMLALYRSLLRTANAIQTGAAPFIMDSVDFALGIPAYYAVRRVWNHSCLRNLV